MRLMSGGGSYPDDPHGWQRSTRDRVSQKPRHAPFLSIAVSAYSEHVGRCLHSMPIKGFNVQR
jgi:hypothetical protein